MLCGAVVGKVFWLRQTISVDNVYAEMLHCKHPLGEDKNMADRLTPFEQKIAAGINSIVAFLSEATCGEACWEAREDVCRCSCGGKNHGCMRTADGTRPVRTAKIDGHRYELKAVGFSLYAEAKLINDAAGPRSVSRCKASKWDDTVQAFVPSEHVYTYHWSETDKGAPARLKTASKSQLAAWPELTAYRDTPAYRTPYLLWVKITQAVSQ